jgi:hypothetical protein
MGCSARRSASAQTTTRIGLAPDPLEIVLTSRECTRTGFRSKRSDRSHRFFLVITTRGECLVQHESLSPDDPICLEPLDRYAPNGVEHFLAGIRF